MQEVQFQTTLFKVKKLNRKNMRYIYVCAEKACLRLYILFNVKNIYEINANKENLTLGKYEKPFYGGCD